MKALDVRIAYTGSESNCVEMAFGRDADGNGDLSRRLAEIRLDEVFRVSDKAFVAWRLLTDPPSFGGSFARIVFWIDIPSRSIISEGSELSFRPWTPQSRTEVREER